MPDWVLYVIIIVLLSERISKLIPDHKTGVVGWVRKFFKVLAFYTENIR